MGQVTEQHQLNREAVVNAMQQVKMVWRIISDPENATPVGKEKGKLNGLCNVAACQYCDTVVFYNIHTQAYYCGSCAIDMLDDDYRYYDAPRMIPPDANLIPYGVEGYDANNPMTTEIFKEKRGITT